MLPGMEYRQRWWPRWLKWRSLRTPDVGAEPGKVIAGLNSTLVATRRGNMPSAVYVALNQARRVGCYSPKVVHRCCSGTARTRTLLELKENGLLLGVRPSEEYAQTDFTLEAGDRLLVYTDGLVGRAVNARGEAFGEARLGESLRLSRIFRRNSLRSVCWMRCLAGPRTERPGCRPTTSL